MISDRTYAVIGIVAIVIYIIILFFAIVKYEKKLANCQSKGGVLVQRHTGTYVCIKVEVIK